MTKKGFTFDIDNENGIDEPYFCNGTDSFYVDNADEMELFIEELNELVEEKEIAIEGIKVANDLINRYGGDELKHKWKKEVNVND